MHNLQKIALFFYAVWLSKKNSIKFLKLVGNSAQKFTLKLMLFSTVRDILYFILFSLQLACISHKKRCLKPGDVSWNRSVGVIVHIVELVMDNYVIICCVIYNVGFDKSQHVTFDDIEQFSYLNAVILRHCHS